MIRNRATIPILLLLAAACSTPADNDPNKRDKHGRLPEDAAKYAQAVKDRVMRLGMHKSEIKKVFGGGPDTKRKVERGGQTYEMWIYRSRSLDLYFDSDGYLMRTSGLY